MSGIRHQELLDMLLEETQRLRMEGAVQRDTHRVECEGLLQEIERLELELSLVRDGATT